jgi:Fe2+ or Zn2+ uptake regulation protein
MQNALKSKGLRDTQPRRLVIEALARIRSAASPAEIHDSIDKKGAAINLVTVYRVLEVLREKHLIHQHPCDGRYSLCSMPDASGHHGFLHCSSCGKTEEFVNAALCRMEDAIARKAKFRPSEHVSELIGTCHSCSSRA